MIKYDIAYILYINIRNLKFFTNLFFIHFEFLKYSIIKITKF